MSLVIVLILSGNTFTNMFCTIQETLSANSDFLFFRFFRQFLIFFALHLSCISMFRAIAATFRDFVLATTMGSVSVVLLSLFGGFVLRKRMFCYLKHTFHNRFLKILCNDFLLYSSVHACLASVGFLVVSIVIC